MEESQNTGKEYELFVARLQRAILNSEQYIQQKNIKVEINKKIVDKNGLKREFDVYWEYELAGIKYKTIIECKDYQSNISLEKIDALVGKLQDFPDIRGIFATRKGYQSGAKDKAKKNKIDLLIFREQNNTDWKDKDGNPLIRRIDINFTIMMPARILSFAPTLDGNWVKENTDIDISKPFQLSCPNDRIIIEDIEHSKKYSLFDLEHELFPLEKGCAGTFEKTENFQNAFIYCDKKKLKLSAYKVEYVIGKPFKNTMYYAKELIGVVEYLSKGEKKLVFNHSISCGI